MATTVYDLVAKVTLDAADAAKSLTGFHDKLDATKGKADTATGGLGGFVKSALPLAAVVGAGVAVAGALDYVVQAASESEQVMTRTNSVIASTHGVAGITADAVTGLAANMLQLTGIDDESTQAAENVLLAYTNIGHDAFPGATTAVADLATALAGGAIPSMSDMEGAANIVGKALENPAKAAQSLRAAHVVLTAEQQKSIKTMMDQGDIAGAQGVIMDALKTKYGGAAEAAGTTFAGQMAKASNELHNVAETIGGMLLPMLTNLLSAVTPLIEQFIKWLEPLTKNQQAMQALGIIVGVLAIAFGVVLVSALVAAAVAAWGLVSPFLPFIALGAAIIAVIIAIALGLKWLYDNVQPVHDAVNLLGTALQTGLHVALTVLGAALATAGQAMSSFGSWIQSVISFVRVMVVVIQTAIASARATWTAGWNAMSSIVSSVWNLIRSVVQAGAQVIQSIINIATSVMRGDWSGAWNQMRSLVSSVMSGIQNIVRGAISAVVSIMQAAGGQARSAMQNMVNSAVGAIAGLGGRLAGAVRDAINQMIGAIRGMAGNVAGAMGSLLSGIHLPHFQSGGITPYSGLFNVGEAGPEVVALPGGSTIFPHGAAPNVGVSTRGSMAASGPISVTIPIYVAGRQVAQVLLPDIVAEIRRATGTRNL